jgi:hypothetical protein
MCWTTPSPADTESSACSTRRNPAGLDAWRVVQGSVTRARMTREEKSRSTSTRARSPHPSPSLPIGALL